MSAVSQILPPPVLSDEVRAFAAEKGVTAYLPGVAEFTRRLFPQARMRVLVREDPELSYNTQIHFDVDETGMDVEEQMRRERQWTAEVGDVCPATHVHVFNLLTGMWP